MRVLTLKINDQAAILGNLFFNLFMNLIRDDYVVTDIDARPTLNINFNETPKRSNMTFQPDQSLNSTSRNQAEAQKSNINNVLHEALNKDSQINSNNALISQDKKEQAPENSKSKDPPKELDNIESHKVQDLAQGSTPLFEHKSTAQPNVIKPPTIKKKSEGKHHKRRTSAKNNRKNSGSKERPAETSIEYQPTESSVQERAYTNPSDTRTFSESKERIRTIGVDSIARSFPKKRSIDNTEAYRSENGIYKKETLVTEGNGTYKLQILPTGIPQKYKQNTRELFGDTEPSLPIIMAGEEVHEYRLSDYKNITGQPAEKVVRIFKRKAHNKDKSEENYSNLIKPKVEKKEDKIRQQREIEKEQRSKIKSAGSTARSLEEKQQHSLSILVDIYGGRGSHKPSPKRDFPKTTKAIKSPEIDAYSSHIKQLDNLQATDLTGLNSVELTSGVTRSKTPNTEKKVDVPRLNLKKLHSQATQKKKQTTISNPYNNVKPKYMDHLSKPEQPVEEPPAKKPEVRPRTVNNQGNKPPSRNYDFGKGLWSKEEDKSAVSHLLKPSAAKHYLK